MADTVLKKHASSASDEAIIEQNTTDEEFTEEETKNQNLMNEEDLIQGMLDASSGITDETTRIEIRRGGRLYFVFDIHGLQETTVEEIRKKYTKYKRNRANGIKIADHVDEIPFRSSLIYNATTDEYKEKLWNNKAIKEGLKKKGFVIVTALDVIDAVLLAGEKERIITELNRLSGYDTFDDISAENQREETVKN